MRWVAVTSLATLTLWLGIDVRAEHYVHSQEAIAVQLPSGVEPVWDLERAYRQSTDTREQVCINGLWRWQPAEADASAVPNADWGFFKVPGCWPGISDYMQKDCQNVFAHPAWQGTRLRDTKAAWYQREITVPRSWGDRRIVLQAEYVNSFAHVYVEDQRVGELRFPAGEVDLTSVCQPGRTYTVSMLVVAMPLKAVMLSYRDTASARQVEGRVARRGLCGDVYLVSTPLGPRIEDVKIETSVRQKQMRLDVACERLDEHTEYTLRTEMFDGKRRVQEFVCGAFLVDQLTEGRIAFAIPWMPQKLWNVDTPQNTYELKLTLCDRKGAVLDAHFRTRFGFREFWIDGRDFILNGARIQLSSVPLDNAQVGAAWATYAAACESMRRLQSFGINFVYTHNYGCEPGSHLGFEEILRAADDVGMLVSFSQPHFSHYDWDDSAAGQDNGYARHAAFYVRAAQNHPSVVAYSTSHNATGYAEDMNPDMIDGVQAKRSQWSGRNVERAGRVEAIIRQLDASRVVYHHASGNLGSMHTSNFYANFVPVQEMSDWFEHWATSGVKPLFTCEYSVPMTWDWTMYRGWYKGKREFGSARAPWEFCVAEWNAQFFGDEAYQISEQEKKNLRWEARQFQAGRVWQRWDYPYVVGSSDIQERYPVFAKYFADNWPAFRTWGVSANSPWNHGHYWRLRQGVDKGRQDLEVDWQNLQRPGFSPDYIDQRYERIDLAFEMSDWIPTVAAQELMRNNLPLLAYLAGRPGAFTSKDHNYLPGEALAKQLIMINNSRKPVTARCTWSLDLPQPIRGSVEASVAAGQQTRKVLSFSVPDDLAPGTYQLRAEVAFSTGLVQTSNVSIDVLPRPSQQPVRAKIAVFDPKGETATLLDGLAVSYDLVDAQFDPTSYEMLIVGKNALTATDPAPNITTVRTGLKVLQFEQTPEVLEKRFGFRVATYGLRQVYARVPDHPALLGLSAEHLRDWRGAATVVPSRLEYRMNSDFNYVPTVTWCGIPVPRLWRCGNRGNVATALIEKPHRGDFLPIIDGGYSLQYSPLIEYREGEGMMLFCQLDVTGRTEDDPAAQQLVQNLLDYVATWEPSPNRDVVYVGDPRGAAHLKSTGVSLERYSADSLSDRQVLVVGPGGGHVLAEDREAIERWLAAGGHLLVMGLDMEEANAFMPDEIVTRRGEHIAGFFDAHPADSLLAGLGPADVHCPAPRELPLLTGEGATAVGDGVLGRSKTGNVVFCQLPPFTIEVGEGQHNLKRTFRRTSFLMTRLLANMGAAGTTPVLKRFGTPVGSSAEASLIRNGDFRTASELDVPAEHWMFTGPKQASCIRKPIRESNRTGESASSGGSSGSVDTSQMLLLSVPSTQGGKSSAMLAQHDLPVKKGQWYRIAFRARSELLAAKSVAVTITNMDNWRSLFEYQRFEPGPKWKVFQFDVQANDSAADNTRFQIWFDGPGKLGLADVRVLPISDPAVGRWQEGLYLDSPEAWDDPYRFFRW